MLEALLHERRQSQVHSENHNHPPKPEVIASKSVLAVVRKESKRTVEKT